MSAAHRAGDGGGYYPGGEVLGRQRQEEAAGWGAGYYPPENGRSWPGGGEMGGAGGAQNAAYSGYDPSSWSCAGHPRAPYPPGYPVGGQGMDHYANGSYGPAYSQSSMTPPYPALHPANPYYAPPPPAQTHYAVDPYKQQGGAPQAPSHWGYPQQHPQYPQYPAPPPPGMPPQSPQSDNWNMYGAQNPYQWHAAPPPPHNPSAGHYAAGGRTQWSGGDVQPAVYDVKDPPQPPNYNHQRQFPGYPSSISQQGPPSEAKPNPPTPSAPPNPHYSASPQMYNRKDPSNQETIPRGEEDPVSAHPGIVKIIEILQKVAELEEEVDEFVGRKTDMSYRCLEELLTKQLLELDSVETGGQDSVRQARKEAVRKLQSILERLERKGL